MITLSYIVGHQDVPARLDLNGERNDQMRYPDGVLYSETRQSVTLSVSYLPDLEWVEVVDRYNGSRRLVAIVWGTVL